MKFKTQSKTAQMPDVNLVPMMDVLMTILTFFIIISMTLGRQQQALNVTLPSTESKGSTLNAPDPLVVSLNKAGQLGVQSKTVDETQLNQEIQTYLGQNPQGAVLLKADKEVSYEQLAQLLSKMQAVGGERVSLAIEGN